MKKAIHNISSIFCLLCFIRAAWAFDDDISINEPKFKPENFLDIKAYEFRKLVDEEWYKNPNGWRMRGGSLDYNLSYIDSEVRLEQELSEKFSLRFGHEYFTYYGKKPFQAPVLELGMRPLQLPLELTILGTPVYDKEQADLGLGLTLGKRREDHISLAYLYVDRYYNSKNVFDDSYYEKSPHTLSLNGSYRYNKWQLRLWVESYDPLHLVTPERNQDFHYQGDKQKLSLNYHFTKQALAGITLYRLDFQKALSNDDENREQEFAHQMIDVYWASPYKRYAELSFGVRFDQLLNQVRDLNNSNRHYDYTYDTLQIYGTAYREYSPRAAWDLGLYVGNVTRHKDFLNNTTDNKPEETVQAKLRTSWEYHTPDKRSRFMVHFSFNLDDLFNRPGDGGGLSYQGLF